MSNVCSQQGNDIIGLDLKNFHYIFNFHIYFFSFLVVPSVNEPSPGWVDSLNGPIGICVGAGKGVIRSLYCFEENRAEVIPVDFAINGLLTLAWQFCINPK